MGALEFRPYVMALFMVLVLYLCCSERWLQYSLRVSIIPKVGAYQTFGQSLHFFDVVKSKTSLFWTLCSKTSWILWEYFQDHEDWKIKSENIFSTKFPLKSSLRMKPSKSLWISFLHKLPWWGCINLQQTGVLSSFCHLMPIFQSCFSRSRCKPGGWFLVCLRGYGITASSKPFVFIATKVREVQEA